MTFHLQEGDKRQKDCWRAWTQKGGSKGHHQADEADASGEGEASAQGLQWVAAEEGERVGGGLGNGGI